MIDDYFYKVQSGTILEEITRANQNTSTSRGLRTSDLDTFPFLGIQVGLLPSGFHYISRQFHLLDLYALVMFSEEYKI
jgi:hypothetical protein